MANPWTKRNPALSLFLSGANAWAGVARGVLMKQARHRKCLAFARAGGRDEHGRQAAGELLGIHPEAARVERQQSQAPPLITSAVFAGCCGTMDMLRTRRFAYGGGSIRCRSTVGPALHLREHGGHEGLPFHGVHEVNGWPAAKGGQRLLEPERHPRCRIKASRVIGLLDHRLQLADQPDDADDPLAFGG